MKNLLLTLFAAGSMTMAAAQQPFHMDTLQYSGRNAIDFVLMGDGYTADVVQQAKFRQDAQRCTDSLFACVPFSHYRRFFNVYALHVISEEEGITHPGIFKADTLWCRSVSQMDTVSRNTFFGTTLDCGGIHRLAYITKPHRADSLLRVHCPTAQQAGVIVNSDEYGGSGGHICVATCERRSHRIFIHELAHSFADLADEYFAGDDFLSENPNQTAESNPEKVRWHRWIGEDGVGVYPHHGTELAEHYFKPTDSRENSRYCMMELLAREFCPVCREALVQSIHYASRFVGDRYPQQVTLPRQKADCTFRLSDILRPEPNTLQIIWKVDGTEIARDTEQVTVPKNLLKKKRSHTVEAIITDNTPMVREEPVEQKITWRIAGR